ncbi:hypothetical protein Nepgr_032264 [Nepenthes gracilis]|uniref:Uncharacterized protein n=1 Tax=Nepenthes gracilis TaxID=150966 RepID=A0AAD3Y856_NEPGR|nr:hypothetical protein Nepgr_032264 [Nepenthes gracilis]
MGKDSAGPQHQGQRPSGSTDHLHPGQPKTNITRSTFIQLLPVNRSKPAGVKHQQLHRKSLIQDHSSRQAMQHSMHQSWSSKSSVTKTRATRLISIKIPQQLLLNSKSTILPTPAKAESIQSWIQGCLPLPCPSPAAGPSLELSSTASEASGGAGCSSVLDCQDGAPPNLAGSPSGRPNQLPDCMPESGSVDPQMFPPAEVVHCSPVGVRSDLHQLHGISGPCSVNGSRISSEPGSSPPTWASVVEKKAFGVRPCAYSSYVAADEQPSSLLMLVGLFYVYGRCERRAGPAAVGSSAYGVMAFGVATGVGLSAITIAVWVVKLANLFTNGEVWTVMPMVSSTGCSAIWGLETNCCSSAGYVGGGDDPVCWASSTGDGWTTALVFRVDDPSGGRT